MESYEWYSGHSDNACVHIKHWSDTPHVIIRRAVCIKVNVS